MSSSWFPEPFEIHVDNPGYGELGFAFYDEDSDARRWVDLTGGELGEVLEAVTQRALGGDWVGPRKMPALTIDEARTVLRSFQRAVVLAACATDRFERVFVEDAPQEPLCLNCNEGSPYHQEVTISERCAERGHEPFGFGSSTSWEQAGERYARARSWWDTRRELRL